MDLALFLLISGVLLGTAYVVIGRRLAEMFGLSDERPTPAHLQRDGLDFEPASTGRLLPQHFSAIAAAGPVVGPIFAGLYFGWGPAWIWIILGSVLIGGIHDFTALVASVRHEGKSVAEIVRRYMNPRAYILFLIFIWMALIYVIVAFTDVTAGTFVAKASVAGADAPGPAVATASVLYLLLAVAMGLAMRWGGMGEGMAKVIFLPLVFGAIYLGQLLPFDLGRWVSADHTQQAWGYLLLVYCLIAAMAPVWMLLQPRGELGGYFLYIIIGLACGGILVGAVSGGASIQQPFFTNWSAPPSAGTGFTLFPILFITVACGACSGFHSIVASGTTSKQLNRETDAKPVAYGGMLLEGFFACLSLATFMVWTRVEGGPATPNFIYSSGIADFGSLLFGWAASGDVIRPIFFQFALLCFATFVFDTLDACTRLARYVLMELLGWQGTVRSVLATLISLAVPVIAIALPRIELNGKALPLWQIFWNIFGSSNQLLAALTLLGVTVWMAKRRMNFWIALGPTIFMLIMTLWSLMIMGYPYLSLWRQGERIAAVQHFQFGIIVSLVVLTLWLVGEALVTWRQFRHEADVDMPEELPEGAGA